MSSAAIVGAGDLGGAVAHALASREVVDRVLLVDAQASLAAGKALDIQQAGAIAGFHTRLAGTADLSRIVGCDICIVADRSAPAGEWQGAEGLARLRDVLRYAGDAPIVFAGTQQSELMARGAAELGASVQRLVGSAGEALRGAVAALVALEARVAPSEVMLSLVGTPPAGFVVPWSEASIGGYAVQTILSPPQLQRLEARTKHLWPLQPYALGSAAAAVADAMLRASRRAFSVFAVLDGEFGARRTVGAIPVHLCAAGIATRHMPSLSVRERVLVESAVAEPFA